MSKEIILCGDCKGEGSTARQGWHDEPNWIRSECGGCNGTGRLIKMVVTEPFKPLDENEPCR